jgi:hypothetical protein
MILSKRERYIAIATVLVVGVLGLDFFIVSPLFARSRDVGEQIDKASADIAKQQKDIKNAKAARNKWTEVSGNTIKRDASEVESQVYSAVQEWGREARMSLAFRNERTEKEKGFTKITYVLTGNGGMEQISRFLHQIQTAKIPVRIVDLSVGTRGKEGVDELVLTVKIASIFQQPENDNRPKPAAAQGTTRAAAAAVAQPRSDER